MSRWIRPLADTSSTAEHVGGKAANLARLAAAGFRVPPGFVVSVDAYREFVDANALARPIDEATASVGDEVQALDRAAAAIRDLFAGVPIPDAITIEIRRAARELAAAASVGLAVRSSSMCEDAGSASFAGQHDTFLNVAHDDVCDRIKQCWASLYSARAIAYRRRMSGAADAMGVVVQQVVPTAVSGVAFTINPVSGSRDEIVINAASGLGEALVSGLVTPDEYVINKASGDVAGTTGALRAREVRQLADLAVAIEQRFGAPQDIEWCLADGTFWILQTRPVTTAAAGKRERWEAPGNRTWVHGGGAIELITEPVSPLLETLFVPQFDRALFSWMDRLGLSDAFQWPIVRGVNGFMYVCLDVRVRPRHVPALLRDLREHMRSMDDHPHEADAYRAAVSQHAVDLASQTLGELYRGIEELLRAGLRYWIHLTMIAQPIYRAERRLTRFYTRIKRADDPPAEVFLRGLPMRPMAADRSVYELSTCVGRPEFESRLRTHLDQFGHQIYSFDPMLPTLSEDPRPVFAAMQSYLDGAEPPDDRLARLSIERETALADMRVRLPARQWIRLSRLAAAAQTAVRLREDAIFDLGLAWRPIRDRILTIGERLRAVGVCAATDDVFWVTDEELRQTIAIVDAGRAPEPVHGQIASRRAAWRRRRALQPPHILPLGARPRCWWKYVFPMPELQRQSRDVIRGLGVSPGRITARARVITDYAEVDRLKTGDILVAHATTPAWTPLFSRAGGLVTDVGGPLTHGSVVAREYGIPAVMGTGSATQLIRDGQIVTVDGTGGCVFVSAATSAR